MKKFKHLLLLVLLIQAPMFFYGQAFADGTNLIFAGFGFPADQIKQGFDKDYKNFYNYTFKNYGIIVLKYEHGLNQYFGMGLNFEYSNSSVTYKYGNSLIAPDQYQVNISSNTFGVYGRLNGHYPIGDKFDIYAGVGLGYLYTINKQTDTNNDLKTSTTILDFDYQITLGMRYMVKERLGLFAELGRATGLCQMGLVFKF